MFTGFDGHNCMTGLECLFINARFMLWHADIGERPQEAARDTSHARASEYQGQYASGDNGSYAGDDQRSKSANGSCGPTDHASRDDTGAFMLVYMLLLSRCLLGWLCLSYCA